MTADTLGGVWTYAVELASALEPHGFEVVLAAMGGPASADRRAQLPGNVYLVESDFRLEWMQDPWNDVRRAGDWLLELQARWRPAVVHLNGYAHGDLPWNAPVVIVGHSCVLSWWEAVHGESVPAEWDEYRERVRRGLRAADAVVAPSHAMLAALKRLYGPFRDALVIPNGRNGPRFRAGVKEALVVAAGRLWDQAKNTAALAEIAPRLAWPVRIVGQTSEASDAGRLSEPQIAELLAKASIYALPARYEPFGLSVLEAALSGCALVLGDIPSLRENWDGAALFVNPEDRTGLERAISHFIENESERRRMASEAYARARTFTPERMARQYLEIYSMAGQAACA